MQYLELILANCTHPNPHFNIIIEAQLQAGPIKTVGKGFKVTSTTNLDDLRAKITEMTEGFETQSGTPEERQPEAVISSLKVMDRSHAPAVNWEDPLNTGPGYKEPEQGATKRRASPKATAEKLAILNSQLNQGFTDLKDTQLESTNKIVEAIKTIPTQASSQPSSLSSLSNINWAPLVHGLVNVVITQLGGSPVQFPTPSQPSSQPPVSQTPAEAPVVSLVQVNELIKAQVTPLLNKVDNLESMISRLSQNQVNIQEMEVTL